MSNNNAGRAPWAKIAAPQPTVMRPDDLLIVFDKFPPSVVGKYQLTLGMPYMAVKVNNDLGLYSLVDDAGVTFNVSTYGATLTNGGNWHICRANQPMGCLDTCRVPRAVHF